MISQSIRGLILERASLDGTAVALFAPGRDPLTYRRLLEQVDQTVHELELAGIRLGDRVAIVLPNGPEMAVAFLAIAAIGACAPLNPFYIANELDHYLADLNPNALIVGAGMDAPAPAVAHKRGIPVIALSPRLDDAAGTFSLQRFQSAAPHCTGIAGSNDIALLLHTSGTTSLPKLVPLTQSNLCHSAHSIAASLGLTTRDRCLNVMPLFHIHGLIGALLSSLSVGASVVCTPGFSAQQFFDWLLELQPSWYTAVPTMHATILARAAQIHPELSECSLRFIRSCSAALPPQVMTRLEQLFSVPVVEAYGMTEASHQIAINPLPPGRRKPGSVGLPTGTDVAIMDQGGKLLGPNQTGAIVIRGENLTPGYIGVPGGGYIDGLEGGHGQSPGQWFATGDQGLFDDDGYLVITGRTKEMINRGGETISPREIEEALLGHPAVLEAVVFALPDARLGEDIGAAAVLRDGEFIGERELRDYVATKLSYFKLPRRILFLPAIPKGPTGKVQRIGLAEKLGIAKLDAEIENEAMPFTAPGSPLEDLLAGMYREALHLTQVGAQTNFFDAGGDSLSALELIVNVEKATGVSLSMAALFDAPTVEKLAELVAHGGETEKRQTKLLLIQPRGSRPAFFVVHAGPLFRRLAFRLGSDQPFLGLHTYPERLPDPVKLEDIAREHVQTILDARPEGPYIIGGWCVGGLVAYEIAQQLRMQDKEVALLVLFDTDCPKSQSENSVVAQAASLKEKLGFHMTTLRQVELSRAPAYVLERLQTFGEKFRRRAWQVLYSLHVTMGVRINPKLRDFEELVYFAARHYRPQPYDGRVLLLRRRLRPTEHDQDGQVDWSELLERLAVRDIPGDHRDMFLEPYVEFTAQTLSGFFEEIPAITTGESSDNDYRAKAAILRGNTVGSELTAG
jgi:acyl-CoA synthetase (AMP-forming)/AMP-acid ligase II/thioesterase domain-containing protein/acyl carrier protein